MFQGQYTVNVGAYYRLAFPSPYRDRFGEKIIITYGFENSLIVTSESKWEELFKKELAEKSVLSAQVRDIRRIFLGGIAYIDFDTQGRFIIPEYLREHANINIKSEATFVWQSNYIEVWDTKSWRQKQQESLKNMSTIAEQLSGIEDGNG